MALRLKGKKRKRRRRKRNHDMWKIVFSVAIISAMNILQGCEGMSMKPHKTSITYGVAEIDKDNDSKDSITESFTIKQDFIWEN
jgi:hypothetical protein